MECGLAVTAMPASNDYYNAFGSQGPGSTNYYNRNTFIVYPNGMDFEKTSVYTIRSFTWNLNQKYNIYCDSRNTSHILKIDNVNYINSTAPTLQASSTILIFSTDTGNNHLLIGRIYSFKLYDSNGTLVRDMIPVRVGQVGYLYDKVSKQLFGNSGTGDFVLGPDVSIPYETEIEYLGIAGCRVDLPFYPSTNYKYYWKVSFNTIENWNYLFNSDGDRGDWFIFGGTETGNHPQLHIGNNYAISSVSLQTNTLYECSLTRESNSMVLKFNNTITNTVACGDFTSSKKLHINGQNCNFYYLKVYDESNNLIYDFIPVRIGQVGYLYDKVSGQLFGNSGAGSFVLGPYKEYLPLTGGTLTGQVGATGFVKSDSSDDYILLGGGGHKSLSDLASVLGVPPLTSANQVNGTIIKFKKDTWITAIYSTFYSGWRIITPDYGYATYIAEIYASNDYNICYTKVYMGPNGWNCYVMDSVGSQIPLKKSGNNLAACHVDPRQGMTIKVTCFNYWSRDVNITSGDVSSWADVTYPTT